jgi:hypothetical protein
MNYNTLHNKRGHTTHQISTTYRLVLKSLLLYYLMKMKNNVFLKVKEHVLDYMTLEDLKMYLEKGHTSQELVQD